jgi:hypothetical protein
LFIHHDETIVVINATSAIIVEIEKRPGAPRRLKRQAFDVHCSRQLSTTFIERESFFRKYAGSIDPLACLSKICDLVARGIRQS